MSTWAKTKLDEQQNEAIEQLQEQTGETKPDTVSYLIDVGLTHVMEGNNE